MAGFGKRKRSVSGVRRRKRSFRRSKNGGVRKMVNRMLFNRIGKPEIKRIESYAASRDDPFTNGGYFIRLTACGPGTDIAGRVGRQITVKGIRVKYRFDHDSTQGSVPINHRVMLVAYNGGVAPTIADLLENASTGEASILYGVKRTNDNISKVLYNKVLCSSRDGTNGTRAPHKINKKLNLIVKWNTSLDSTANNFYNAVYLVHWYHGAINSVLFSHLSQVFYVDD